MGGEINNKKLTLTADTTGGAWTEYSSTIDGITSNNTWYHVAYVIDLPNKQVTFYVNGNKLGNTVTLANSYIAYFTGITNYIGLKNEAATSYPKFYGKLDEVRVSTSLRSADWIKDEYYNQNSPSTFYSLGSEVTSLAVTTQSASGVTGTTVTGNGNITATGGENADKVGFVYSTSSQSLPGNVAPTSSGYTSYAEDTGSFGTGAFTKILTGLNAVTTYYARSYAHNSTGYIYGNEVSFFTISSAGWYNPSWSYRKAITIDHTKVFNTDQTNFPVLINLTSDAGLASHALSTGYDIFFTSSDGATKIPYERESYSSSTGALVAWVNVASLSHTANTILYMYYGNASATDQQQATSTWNANYKSVWHMKEATGTNVSDATSNNHTGTQTGSPIQAAGKIGGSLTFNTNKYLDMGNQSDYNFGNGAFTISAWLYGGSDSKFILGKDDFAGNNNNTLIYTKTSAPLGYAYWPGATNGATYFGAKGSTWHYVTITRTGTSTGGLTAYYDGNVSATNTESRNLSNTTPFRVGQDNVTNTYAFDGSIDETRVSNSVRSADWIKTEYYNQSSPSTFYSLGGEMGQATFTQSAYRFFNNLNSTDVGTPLAVQNATTTLTSINEAFRLRMLLHISNGQVDLGSGNFKLQYVGKGAGTCISPSGGTPAIYTDITGSTAIAYNNNSTPTDGDTLTANANDPTHGADMTVNQTYEEANNFVNSIAAIPAGQDGKWDFSLKDNSAPGNTTYCLKAVKSDGTDISAYTVRPEITTAVAIPAAPTSVSATDGTYTDKVTVTWTKSTNATDYHVWRDATDLGSAGDVATFDDTGANAPTIIAGSSVASDGTYANKVSLSLTGTSANNGTTHTYYVIASNTSGNSASSTTDTGYRSVGPLTYQWQRSATDTDATYSDIIGATTTSYDDTSAPSDGSGRYYKCVLDANGAIQQTSLADRGYRTVAVISVTISPSTTDYGMMPINAVKKAPTGNANNEFIITNLGNVAEDFGITSSNATGGAGWTLSTTSVGASIFMHAYSNLKTLAKSFTLGTVGEQDTKWVPMDLYPNYRTLSTNVAISGTANLVMELLSPSSIGGGDYGVTKNITVTIRATEH